MKLIDIIKQIDHNQIKISSYGKFDEELLKKINYKLRLDWNYYSNRMEGGTLTREETRSVMVGNIDVNGKPFKDLAEMNGHDSVVLEVLKMSNAELRISEKRIKDIHKAIMHEENMELSKEIGQWKSVPNEIINYKNEKMSFTPPSEVLEAVHRLLDNANAELDRFFSKKTAKHPLEIAAQFHIDFITIHPFYDGNGRTTRILTNIILMACGLPVIIIKDECKKSYYQLLADVQLYGGSPDLFYSFIGERILETQELIIKALNGGDIEEREDIDKEIQQTLALLRAKHTKFEVGISSENVAEFIEKIVIPASKYYFEKLQHFESEFINETTQGNLFLDHRNYNIGTGYNPSQLLESIRAVVYSKVTNETRHMKIDISKWFSGFKRNENASSLTAAVNFDFEQYYLEFYADNNKTNSLKFAYGKDINTSELYKYLNGSIKNFIEKLKTIVNSAES